VHSGSGTGNRLDDHSGPGGERETMNVRLEIQVSERTGQAYACVPGNAMWELVEYLSMHRTPVHFGYTEEGFTVTFLHLGKEAAQELLTGWNESWWRNPAQEYGEEPAGARRGYSMAG
jgi:hypothetical protein